MGAGLGLKVVSISRDLPAFSSSLRHWAGKLTSDGSVGPLTSSYQYLSPGGRGSLD